MTVGGLGHPELGVSDVWALSGADLAGKVWLLIASDRKKDSI